MTKNIFTKNELYNLCLAQVSADSIEKESGYPSHWSEFLHSDRDNMEDKFDNLCDADQNEFECQLKKAADSLRSGFEVLNDSMDDEEEFNNIRNGLVDDAANELNDFLLND